LTGEKFWASLDIRGNEDCWEWQRGRDDGGYGCVCYSGKRYGAHRLAWELTNGPIPEGLLVCHSCDNPPCCNPKHLFLGTHGDNMQDALTKGRFQNTASRMLGNMLWVGRKHSEGTRRKIGDAQRGIPKSEEHCRNMSKAGKGKRLSDAHKRKVGDAHRGRQLPEEHRRKIKEAVARWWAAKKAAQVVEAQSAPTQGEI